MKELAIKVESLYKQYCYGTNNKSFVGNKANTFFTTEINFWALQDLSFTINKGEVFGIVGDNGAGKSTLLKILSGITKPTKGKVQVNGRISSLLEVGTGFHTELTGRENVYMNGSLLGMKQHEIKAKFDDIISFSETGRFIDTPVKHYSSGMQVRLAFSVAIHLETEILIIDEVLSVGDIAFQQKSMKAIKSLLEKNITVIMVSHNIENIRNLCDKVLILKDGKIDGFGDVREQTQLYISQKFKQIEAPSFKSWKTDDLTKNDIIKILTIGVKAKTKEFGEKIYNSDDLEIVINFNVKVKTPCIDVAFKVKDATNYVLLGVITDRNLKEEMIGNYKVKCNIPPYIFNEGLFKIDVRFLKQKVQGKLLYLNSVISFKVCTDMAKNTSRAFQTPGPLKLNTKWEFQKVNLED